MEKDNTVAKRLILFIILFVFVLPVLQQLFNFVEIKPLKGSFEETSYTEISLNNWFDGSYQSNAGKYLKEEMGFRNWLVRLHNQISYSLFDHVNAKHVVIGKEGYLYTKAYINAYLGKDFIGENEIINKVDKIALIQDTLSKIGTDLIIIFAAGKGKFYNEYIPSKFNPSKVSVSNQDYYMSELKKKNISMIDFNSWFSQIKHNSEFPLFPKNGIHWSYYGEYLVADSIINYIEELKGINLPHFLTDSIIYDGKIRHGDDDIEQSMNLIFNLSSLKMAYPQFEIVGDSNTHSPDVLTIADSFYWGIYDLGLSKEIFNNSEFWYYHKKIYPQSFKKELLVENVDLKSRIEKQDVIILMSTDATLEKFTFGFIDDVYNIYFSNDNPNQMSN
jgi:hypothetical protein